MKLKIAFYAAMTASSILSQTAWALENSLTYKNSLGSLLEIRLLENDKITGSFTSAVVAQSCPQAVNEKRPVSGYLIGNTLAFSVVYPLCQSVLTVNGNLSKDRRRLDTISIVNKQVEDMTREVPGARFIGHELYERVD